MNAILIQGVIFSHGFIEIILTILYLVFQQIVRIEEKKKVYEQISNFKNNSQTRLSEGKSALPNFSTQDTLDELSFND